MKMASADCDNADAEELDRTVAPNMKHQTTTDFVFGASQLSLCTKRLGTRHSTMLQCCVVAFVPAALEPEGNNSAFIQVEMDIDLQLHNL